MCVTLLVPVYAVYSVFMFPLEAQQTDKKDFQNCSAQPRMFFAHEDNAFFLRTRFFLQNLTENVKMHASAPISLPCMKPVPFWNTPYQVRGVQE